MALVMRNSEGADSSRWHIPNMLDPCDALPDIPCLCEPGEYDREGIFDFPSRRGWTVDFKSDTGPVRLDGTNVSDEERGAFLQSWLFFGLMYDAFRVFKVTIKLEDCITRNSDGSARCITLAPLTGYFPKCQRLAERTRESRLAVLEKLAKLLREVGATVRRYTNTLSPTSWRMAQALPLEAIIAIAILGESFLNAGRVALRLPYADFTKVLGGVGFVWGWNRAHPLEQRMLSSGWCPSTAKMVRQTLDTTGVFVASHLKLSSHSRAQSHEKCTETQCYANHVDESTYRTKHTQDCQGCAHIAIDVEELAEILRQGLTPVVTIATTSPGPHPNIKLRVETSIPYVAISHVWAHGLGNARANSLPGCQLSKIKRMVMELPPMDPSHGSNQFAVWIDTLCIPVAPELKPLRKVAISRLEETFRNADQVLVLDTDLMNSSRWASDIERATRLLCSAWMRRLWTYQEAVVSKLHATCEKLFIQFSDGPASFHSIIKNHYNLCHSESAVRSLLIMLPLTGEVSSRLLTLMRALQYRSTSRASDEAICLAAVLGHDVSQIVQADDEEERMAILYSFLDRVPAELIFWTAPRLHVEGYRWAPRSLLQQAHSIVNPDFVDAPRDSNGLYVDYAGLRFVAVAPPTARGTHFLLEQGLDGPFKSMSTAGRKSGKTEDEWREIVAEWDVFDALVLAAKRAAVIINPNRIGPHALVEILREDKTKGTPTKFCRFLALVNLRDLQAREEKQKHFFGSGRIVTENVASGSGLWCVG